jgi:glycosyltransferase involved in cell wall biosynthesis
MNCNTFTNGMRDTMKILHAPINIAGQASILSRAERSLGIKSDVLVFNHTLFEYEYDYNLQLTKYPRILRGIIIILNFFICYFKYDTFHFHFGRSLLPFNCDLHFYKFFKKKTIMHYWGSDVIQTDIAKKYTLLDEKIFDQLYPALDNEKKRGSIKKINNLVDISIVGDYSLLAFSPNSCVVRQAIILSQIPYIGCELKKNSITIIHAPTQRGLKGTRYILPVIDQLKKEGYPIDFILVEKKPHHEAIEIFKKADIIIDDLLQGPYGILSIECMAMGKPVLDYIHESFVRNYPELPIVNTNPDTLYDNLKKLIETPDLRISIGKQGREYVEKNHDAKIIAAQMMKIYQNSR